MISERPLSDAKVGDQLSATELPTVWNRPVCGGNDCENTPLEIDWEGNEQMAFSEYNCKMCGGSWELVFTYAHLNILGLPGNGSGLRLHQTTGPRQIRV